MTDERQPLPDDLIQRAYEAMCFELDHWQIVGPLKDGSCVAQRWEERRGYVKPPPAIVLPGQVNGQPPTPKVVQHRLKDKPFAVACVQYHGIQAALESVRDEIVGLG